MPVEIRKFLQPVRTEPPVDSRILRINDEEVMVFVYTGIPNVAKQAEIREKQALGFPMAEWELRIIGRLDAKTKLSETQTTCYWCGKPFSKSKPATIEHIIPLSLGGKDNIENLTLSHRKCNSLRGSMSPEEFRASPQFAFACGKGPRPENKWHRKKVRRHIGPSTARHLIRQDVRKARRAAKRAERQNRPEYIQRMYIQSKLFV